ncbi:hypothetical protein D3C71_1589770 [compost metagenome]
MPDACNGLLHVRGQVFEGNSHPLSFLVLLSGAAIFLEKVLQLFVVGKELDKHRPQELLNLGAVHRQGHRWKINGMGLQEEQQRTAVVHRCPQQLEGHPVALTAGGDSDAGHAGHVRFQAGLGLSGLLCDVQRRGLALGSTSVQRRLDPVAQPVFLHATTSWGFFAC